MARSTIVMNNGNVKTMETRFARVLVGLNKAVYADSYEKKVIEQNSLNNDKIVDDKDELSKAREEYKEKFGKRPFHGWGLDVLKSKIAEAE